MQAIPAKKKLLKNIIEFVPTEGWSMDALHQGAIKAGYAEEYAELIFPGAAREAVDYHIMELDTQMLSIPLQERRISQRIKEMLINRVRLIARNRPVATRTASFLALPWNLIWATEITWRTVDLIWREAGNDISTDYNYYTKRTLLASIYTVTILYMLSDDSPDLSNTIAFMDRRFRDVEKLSKIRATYVL